MINIDWLGKVNPSWGYAPLFTLGSPKKTPNKGMLESNLLSLSYGRIIRRNIESSDGLVPASYETYQIVEPGDTVLRFTDLQNDQRSLRSGLVEERGIITSAYLSFTPDRRRLNPAFFAHMMRAVDLSKVFYRMGSGVRQSLNWGEFSLMRLPLPPLETQQRIADYLDRETAEIDAAVADLDKYVELLEKRRQVLVSEAVDSLSSASLIKTVRNLETLGWLELGRGKVISKEDMENSPGDYPVYSSAFTDNGFFGKYGEYLFEDERISWSIDGGGMPFYRHKHRYSLTNVSGWMRVADNSVLDVKYLYYAVLNEWYRNSFDYAFKAHPSVIRDLYSISIPDLSSQQQMADYLDRETVEIDNLIAESKKLRDLLLKRRSVLITEVVTGRKQV